MADDINHLAHDDQVDKRRQERIARDWRQNDQYEVLIARLAAGEPAAVAAMTGRLLVEVGLYESGKAAAAAHPNTKEN